MYDTVILFLTVIKLREDNVKNSVVGNQILRDNVLYFVIVSVTNIVVLVINCLGPRFDSIKPLTLPYPTLMTTAMGTRWVFPKATIHAGDLLTGLDSVYLNLRLYTRRKYASETLPTGSSVPFGSEATMAASSIKLKSMKSGVLVLQSTHVESDRGSSKPAL